MNAKRPDVAALLPFVIAGIVVLGGAVLLVLAGYFLVMRGPSAPELERPTATPGIPLSIPTATPVSTLPAQTGAVAMPTATQGEPPTAPPTDVPPTGQPTTVPTNPPPPTATRAPTSSPTPPPTPTPAAGQVINAAFSVENPVVGVNQRVWFNFSVTNPSQTDNLPFGYLGAALMNSAGQNVAFQASWTGSELAPGQTLNWRDGLAIGTPGTYSLQLSICYSSVEACNGAGGNWQLLAQPVTITVQ